jgi:sterol desaturase/sphingolipid hydroxylase (fatty acid hydroxylase superfamily)
MALALLYVAFSFTSLGILYIVVLFLMGWLFFTLLEYSAHRFLFHMETDTPIKQKIQYGMHGVHHDYPKDKDRLAMPPPMSIAIAAVFFAIFYALLDTKVFAFLPGLLTGYSSYLLIHYLVHAYPPPNNFFKMLWVNHAIHHYKDHSRVFGVSSPLWDMVFGTMPIKNKP